MERFFFTRPALPFVDQINARNELKFLSNSPISTKFLSLIFHKPTITSDLVKTITGKEVSFEKRSNYSYVKKYIGPLLKMKIIQKYQSEDPKFSKGRGRKPLVYDISDRFPDWFFENICISLGVPSTREVIENLNSLYHNRFIREYLLNPFERKITLEFMNEKTEIPLLDCIENLTEILRDKGFNNGIKGTNQYLHLLFRHPFYFSLFLYSFCLFKTGKRGRIGVTLNKRIFTQCELTQDEMEELVKRVIIKLPPESFDTNELYTKIASIIPNIYDDQHEEIEELKKLGLLFSNFYLNEKLIKRQDFMDFLKESLRLKKKRILIKPKIQVSKVTIKKKK